LQRLQRLIRIRTRAIRAIRAVRVSLGARHPLALPTNTRMTAPKATEQPREREAMRLALLLFGLL